MKISLHAYTINMQLIIIVERLADNRHAFVLRNHTRDSVCVSVCVLSDCLCMFRLLNLASVLLLLLLHRCVCVYAYELMLGPNQTYRTIGDTACYTYVCLCVA